MDISILVGGQAGDGIKQSGVILAKIFNELGYRVFVYDDYQSLIRGGHNFSIVRVSDKEVYSHNDHVDLLVALNQDTIEKHKWRTKEIIYDSDKVKSEGKDIPARSWAKEKGSQLLRNSVFIGAICSYTGIGLEVAKNVVKNSFHKMIDENMEALKFGYGSVDKKYEMKKIGEPIEVMTGNEAVARGAAAAGMKLYIAYPMTPSSSILHYLAKNGEKLGVTTVQDENEIGVANMAVGSCFAGVRTMVGTSGGGLALMTETISLCSQSESPVVFVNSQRAGPSTGVPTYTMQADLKFVKNAGHGDVNKLVMAPGDAEESYFFAAKAMNLAWKYQIPVFLLVDKQISESTFSVKVGNVKKEEPRLWDGKGEYQRYKITENGISPLAFPGDVATAKGTSYEHYENGTTTEEPEAVAAMQEKRLRKMEALKEEMKKGETVKVYGKKDAKVTLLTWGSTKGACIEVANQLGLKVVRPLYLEPMPVWELDKHLKGRVIAVEVNATGQLADMLGIKERILKYDGRPFTPGGLRKKLEEIL
ncbi:MAG: 2-oxoacid:acceptor oxidoreductase subunit alpha [archaeon]|nr:MAG: 2-oxoacid:acceptor oxidoreductase subunit alpha [archaeon]